MVEAATEDYPEVQDLLKRFTTLKDANKDLTEAQTRDEGETERLRSDFSSYTKERREKQRLCSTLETQPRHAGAVAETGRRRGCLFVVT